MSKIIFGLEDYDKKIGINSINMVNPSWYNDLISHSPKTWVNNIIPKKTEYSKYKNFLKFFNIHVKSFATFKTHEKITEKNYLYYVPIFNVEFIEENKNIGFKYISDKFKNDIIQKKCKIVIHMTDEGYHGCEVDETIETIESWRKKEGFPEYSVFFITGNILINDTQKIKNSKIKAFATSILSEDYLSVPEEIEKIKKICEFIPVDHKNLFLSYNHTPHIHRIYFGLKVFKENLIDKSIFSFHDFENHKFIDNFDYKFKNNFSKNELKNFSESLPIKINNIDANKNDFNIGQTIFLEDYKKTFMSLVTETLTFNDSVYFSEKTFKPIVCGHPFMTISSKNSLTELKKMGYKTFDKWWSEEYDKCDNYEDRVNLIIENVNILKNKSINELLIIRNEMKEILEHNQNLFFERTKNKDKILYNIFKKIIDTNNE